MSVIPAEFGPVIDRSEDAAREFILCKLEPVERVLIQYRKKCWRCYTIYGLIAQSAGNIYDGYTSRFFTMNLVKT